MKWLYLTNHAELCFYCILGASLPATEFYQWHSNQFVFLYLLKDRLHVFKVFAVSGIRHKKETKKTETGSREREAKVFCGTSVCFDLGLQSMFN